MKHVVTVFAICFSVLLSGCGTLPGAAIGAAVGSHHGPGAAAAGAVIGGAIGSQYDRAAGARARYHGQQIYQPYGGGYATGVRVAPCQPFQADAFMQWAQGAGGNAQHSRSASVSNSDGQVHCSSNESASSSSSKR